MFAILEASAAGRIGALLRMLVGNIIGGQQHWAPKRGHNACSSRALKLSDRAGLQRICAICCQTIAGRSATHLLASMWSLLTPTWAGPSAWKLHTKVCRHRLHALAAPVPMASAHFSPVTHARLGVFYTHFLCSVPQPR